MFVFAAIAIAVVLLIPIASLANVIADCDVRYTPDYEEINLKDYPGIASGVFSEEDYNVLLKQTGLGKDAVDSVFRSVKDPVGALEEYQRNFFNPPAYRCDEIGIITKEERLYDDEGHMVNGFNIADVRDGDILLTKATHSFGWRHGHAAIVIDALRGKTLEAVLWGQPSMIQNISKWQTYPTFIQLRLKDGKIAEKAAAFAEENLDNIDYGLLTGLFTKYKEKIDKTQCAHLPWYAYMHYGYDLDSNGGWLVTPKDLSGSKYLEIVQIYGVDPDEIWK